jgi:exopolysaccharide biosynthesis protein
VYKGKHVQTKQKGVRGAKNPELAEEPQASSLHEPAPVPVPAEKPRPAKRPPRRGKHRRLKKALIIILAVLAVLGSLYSVFVFSNNAFIKKWRTIYIETAMSTYTHQWLATAFIPHSIIDGVMKDAAAENAKMANISTTWGDDNNAATTQTSSEKDDFYKTYWELDETKFEAYLKEHPNLLANGYSGIVINNLDCDDKELTTKFGEIIRALNVPDKVIIMQVTGDNYVGSLACVKDPTQLSLQKAKLYGSYGELIESYCENNVLAINASGFRDADGVGTGGTIVGSYVLDGKEYGYPDAGYLFFGFKNDNRLYISWGIGDKSEYKWAMQFSPALVSNGKSLVEGSNGWGMQPRSAIGQTKDGEVLLLVVDGRQVGYSIGCTVGDCADILLRHNAYQAANLDGGSSSIMAYEGSIITKNSSKSSNGRTLPNAFVVSHPK